MPKIHNAMHLIQVKLAYSIFFFQEINPKDFQKSTLTYFMKTGIKDQKKTRWTD